MDEGGRSSSASPPGAATRPEVGFLAVDGSSSRLFVATTALEAPHRAGVVVCSPLHADFAKNYRNEVLLAQALAAQGCAATRFHYRGQGHSDGNPENMDLDSLTADALTAAAHLQARTGATQLGFVGTRLGALVASGAAASYAGSPVAFWEPVVRPAKYMREAIRARMMGGITGSSQQTSATELREQLRRDGSLDIYGYPIHHRLVESLENVELHAALGTGERSIQLVQVSSGRELRSEYAELSTELAAQGQRVTAELVAGTVGWWFRGAGRDRDQPDLLTDATVASTADWMAAEFDPARTQP